MKTLVKFLFCLLILNSFAFAQQDETIKVETNVVRLNIGVVDRQGRPITTLNQNDFAVYENSVKQKIQRFEPVTSPFSLVVLLDVSGSTKTIRQLMSQAAARFVDSLAPDDRVAVILFNEKTEVLTDFTTSREKIVYAISLVQSQKRGGETMLYQALDFSLDKLKKEGNRRKAIVVLTDGIDTQLETEDRRAVSAANSVTKETAIAAIKTDQSRKLNEVLDNADRQGVTIFPLALPTGDPARLPDPTPFQVAKFTAARDRLQILANRSGGSFNAINRLEDMSRLYVQVAAELRVLYTIDYQPANDKRDGQFRQIKIEVPNQQVTARTRAGYYAR